LQDAVGSWVFSPSNHRHEDLNLRCSVGGEQLDGYVVKKALLCIVHGHYRVLAMDGERENREL
jgi:hypothetical protein